VCVSSMSQEDALDDSPEPSDRHALLNCISKQRGEANLDSIAEQRTRKPQPAASQPGSLTKNLNLQPRHCFGQWL
jgi:hypothetical protein